jgi:hypothetical protein
MFKNDGNIFIASSNELKMEREKCILIFNHINKIRGNFHLNTIEWEYDKMHGTNPNFSSIQDAINPLLVNSSCVIFIFYSKIGKFTIEEYQLASKLKKQIFIYFKMGFSPMTKNESDLYGQLLEFKTSLSNEALYKEYNSIEHFELAIKDDLHFFISESLLELRQGIEKRKKRNNKKDNELINRLSGIMPSTALAISYFENFLSTILKSIVCQEEKILIQADKMVDKVLKLKGVKVMLPYELSALENPHYTEISQQKLELSLVQIKTEYRTFFGFVDKDIEYLVDLPKILVASHRALEYYYKRELNPNDEFRALEKEELRNFGNTLLNLALNVNLTNNLLIIEYFDS